jgi:hypothetical protein
VSLLRFLGNRTKIILIRTALFDQVALATK